MSDGYTEIGVAKTLKESDKMKNITPERWNELKEVFSREIADDIIRNGFSSLPSIVHRIMATMHYELEQITKN